MCIRDSLKTRLHDKVDEAFIPQRNRSNNAKSRIHFETVLILSTPKDRFTDCVHYQTGYVYAYCRLAELSSAMTVYLHLYSDLLLQKTI